MNSDKPDSPGRTFPDAKSDTISDTKSDKLHVQSGRMLIFNGFQTGRRTGQPDIPGRYPASQASRSDGRQKPRTGFGKPALSFR